MKNNKKAIVLALAVSTFIIPVGNDSFAAETEPTEISESGEGTPSTNNTEENTSEENDISVRSEEETTGSESDVESNEVATAQDAPQEEVVKPYGITFKEPDERFQSVEFYKITADGNRVDMAYGNVNRINSNEKLYAKIVMAPGYELGGTGAYITKDDFTVTEVGSGEDSHLVYELDGFTLPGGNKAYTSGSFMFQANQLPKEKPPVEEPKEKENTYTLSLGQMSFADSFEFTAYDPNNPSNSKSVSTKGGSITGIPEGWKLKGEITMPKNKYLIGTGSDLITARDFEMEVIDQGVNNSHVKYTIDDYDIESNLHLGTYSVTAFNHVTYHLNGGTWTDTTLKKQPNLRWDDGDSGQIYQAFITPKQSVYKPTDPTREGYKFLGWKSSSDIGKPDGTNSVHMDKYDFKEVDVNNYSGYALAGIVHLTAQWEELVTKYKDEEGNELSPTEKGLKEDPKVIEGYKHIRTETDEDGNITHVYSQLVTKYEDEEGNELSPTEKGLTEEPKDIDGYKHIRTETDEDGNITHVYRKISSTPDPEESGEDETPTPDPEVPGEDETPTPDPEVPGEDETPTPDPETDKEVDESETPDEDDSTDNTDDDIDESDTTDETETTDKTESTDKDDTPDKPGATDKPETDDESKIEKDSTDDSSVDKVPVPTPSKTVKTSDDQVSSPTRSVVTKSSDKGASNNVKTGVSGAISVASILAVAGAGLYATRNKENEEE